MSDILPQLPKPAGQPPPQPTHTPPTDSFLYGFAPTLLVGSQFLSKSAPGFARKTSENIFGPEIAFGAADKRFHYTLPKGSLLVAPAPFGFVSPENYGLPPNYMAGYNKFLTYQAPSLPAPRLPESEVFKTLPDTDPHVIAANYQQRAREQRRQLEALTLRASLPELLDVYTAATGPQAQKLFFDPADIQRSLEASIRARAPGVEGERLIFDTRLFAETAPHLPKPTNEPLLFPSPLDDGQVVAASGGQLGGDPAEQLLGIRGLVAPAGLDTPPTDARAAWAFNNAPPLVKNLASERNDP